jgi:ferric-dicitrate binding protein FerR (iron transport regulator)
MPNQTPYALRTEEQKEACREATRRWSAAHPESVEAYNKQTQKRRNEQYRADEKYREKCKERSRAAMPAVQRERRAKLKAQVFDHYGRVCICCGETEPFFLTLGHVNGDGAEQRRRVNGGSRGSMRAGSNSAGVYLDIIRRGFPDDVRTECYNCNCGAFRNGGVCPHVKLRQAPISNV